MSATNGLAWETIAKSAYHAFCLNAGARDSTGDFMQEWDDLPRRIQISWEVAVRHTARLTNYLPEDGVVKPLPTEEGLQELEARWIDWNPDIGRAAHSTGTVPVKYGTRSINAQTGEESPIVRIQHTDD